jgi:hypothetical protein
MGYYKELDIRIRNGGDDAMAAALELVPRWIPVSERLPEIDTNVLAAFVDGKRRSRVCEVLFTDFSDEDEPPKPEWCDDYGRIPHSDVTHWMPLPEPPEVK